MFPSKSTKEFKSLLSVEGEGLVVFDEYNSLHMERERGRNHHHSRGDQKSLKKPTWGFMNAQLFSFSIFFPVPPLKQEGNTCRACATLVTMVSRFSRGSQFQIFYPSGRLRAHFWFRKVDHHSVSLFWFPKVMFITVQGSKVSPANTRTNPALFFCYASGD